MLKCTLKEVSKQHWTGYGIYLIRHNVIGRVLYVGQSCCPPIRIRQHAIPSSTLKFDKFLVKHRPAALDWLVEIYDVTECDWLVRTYRPDDYEEYRNCLRQQTVVHISAQIAEAAMIAHCKPAHNYKSGRYHDERTA